MNHLNLVREYLIKGRINKSLEELSSISKKLNDSEIEKTIVLLNYRFKKIKKREQIGEIRTEDNNKLVWAILQTIDEIQAIETLSQSEKIDIKGLTSHFEKEITSPDNSVFDFYKFRHEMNLVLNDFENKVKFDKRVKRKVSYELFKLLTSAEEIGNFELNHLSVLAPRIPGQNYR